MGLTASDVRYDMYDREVFADPYRLFKRLRDEAPLYYNEEYDFYAVSRYEDVGRVLGDKGTFLSGKGMTYDILKACLAMDLEMPEGLFICEDAPQHTIHRSLVSRLFTPKAVNGIAAQISELCREVMLPLAGSTSMEFMADVANQIPIRVIGMLLGLPREDHAELHAVFHQSMHADTANAESGALEGIAASAEWFDRYLDMRVDNPTDDVMTQLLTMELTDADGETRTLRRQEILTYLTLIASAGADTTAMALGWAIKAFSDNPAERAALAANRDLLSNAVEEVIRYEAVSYHASRWVAEDVEFHGHTVPAGSAMVVLPPAANRDERQFPDPDRFDINRHQSQNFSFGFGSHFCLGASLARLEMRIALDEFLKVFPEWQVDPSGSSLVEGINTRGWETLALEVSA